jgi:uncharacterized protein YrrD
VRSIRETIGKPIISIESGDKIGTVADALLEDGTVRLVALVLGGGVLGKEHVLPFSDVHTLGGDTVLVRTDSGVLGGREWRDGGVHASRLSALKGRPVVTASGHRLGEISDVLIEPGTGAFDAIEVSTSDFGGLRSRRSLVRPGAAVRIGPDAVVVPEDTRAEGARDVSDRDDVDREVAGSSTDDRDLTYADAAEREADGLDGLERADPDRTTADREPLEIDVRPTNRE